MSQEMMGAVVKSRAAAGAGWRQVPVPQVGPDHILIQVKAASICGTDLHIYQWDEWASHRIRVPQTMGHETAGRWWRSGRRSPTSRPGTTCRWRPRSSAATAARAGWGAPRCATT